MFKRNILASLTIMAIMISLVGCASNAKKSNLPTTPQPPSTSTRMPADHPTETPVQPGGNLGQADAEKKINELINKNYPGEWKVAGSTLSKGTYTENGNYKIVDDIEGLFPDTMGVSIFIGEERISSSVKQGTERVLKGYPTPSTVGEVMKSGTTTSTESSGYLKVYLPLKSGDKTVAVLTVSIPRQ